MTPSSGGQVHVAHSGSVTRHFLHFAFPLFDSGKSGTRDQLRLTSTRPDSRQMSPSLICLLQLPPLPLALPSFASRSSPPLALSPQGRYLQHLHLQSGHGHAHGSAPSSIRKSFRHQPPRVPVPPPLPPNPRPSVSHSQIMPKGQRQGPQEASHDKQNVTCAALDDLKHTLSRPPPPPRV